MRIFPDNIYHHHQNKVTSAFGELLVIRKLSLVSHRIDSDLTVCTCALRFAVEYSAKWRSNFLASSCSALQKKCGDQVPFCKLSTANRHSLHFPLGLGLTEKKH